LLQGVVSCLRSLANSVQSVIPTEAEHFRHRYRCEPYRQIAVVPFVIRFLDSFA
jgi:hypothetical protein